MTFWKLEEPVLPWGDYHSLLVAGLATANRADQTYESEIFGVALERTGPFVPPISFPSDLPGPIVTADFRRQLEASKLNGLNFLPVVLAKVTDVPWHEWDADAAEPLEHPLGGEPEEYVLELPHDGEIAAQMPPLYFLYPPVADESQSPINGKWLTSPAHGLDFFRSRNPFVSFVSDAAMIWLSRHALNWISFEQAL